MDNITNLGVLDYIMIGLMLLISAGTGIVFRFSGNRQKTMDEYLMGEKTSPKFLVVMSIIVTLASSILMIGVPAEIYRYGSQYAIVEVGKPIDENSAFVEVGKPIDENPACVEVELIQCE
ncbi:sodium-coupled monocarboxylate transporter 1 [Trichonephila clavipes]|nr:sodium-coupled monocarboxylate transporter 1 [Trichonephila clavipes]